MTLTVTVAPDLSVPIITADVTNVSENVGETATFSVTAEGPGTLTYQWQVKGHNQAGNSAGDEWMDIVGATQATFTIESVTSDMNGISFRCIISNANGSVTSSEGLLLVTDVAEEPGTEPDDGNQGSDTIPGGGNQATPETSDNMPLMAMLLLMLFSLICTIVLINKKWLVSGGQ